MKTAVASHSRSDTEDADNVMRKVSAGCRSCSEPSDGGLDPLLDFFIDCPHVPARGRDGWSDHDAHCPRLLHPPSPWPVTSCVMRNGNDELVVLGGQQRATYPVLARLPVRHARALGEDHDPISLVQPLLALLYNLPHRRMARLAIDRNGVQLPNSPTHHRYP